MPQMSSRESRRAALTQAVIGIVAGQGLDRVSVREVAAAAGVSIGTVQHYFPTKEELLTAAYAESVRRIRDRLGALQLGPDPRRNLAAVLRQLLPLDDRRTTEAKVYLAFAAAAATSPALAAVQRSVLGELHTALVDAFTLAWGDRAPAARRRSAAHAVIALADGLALHAVTTTGWLGPRGLTDAADLVVDTLLDGDAVESVCGTPGE